MTKKMFWGKDKEGNAVRSEDGRTWKAMNNGAGAKEVQVCALSVWEYPGKFKGKTIKEIAAEDSEYLEWILEMLRENAPQMDCLRILLK